MILCQYSAVLIFRHRSKDNQSISPEMTYDCLDMLSWNCLCKKCYPSSSRSELHALKQRGYVNELRRFKIVQTGRTLQKNFDYKFGRRVCCRRNELTLLLRRKRDSIPVKIFVLKVLDNEHTLLSIGSVCPYPTVDWWARVWSGGSRTSPLPQFPAGPCAVCSRECWKGKWITQSQIWGDILWHKEQVDNRKSVERISCSQLCWWKEWPRTTSKKLSQPQNM